MDLKRYIDHLFCIVFTLIGGNTLISTERYDKFIDFLLIIYRFQFETIVSQDFAGHTAILKIWTSNHVITEQLTPPSKWAHFDSWQQLRRRAILADTLLVHSCAAEILAVVCVASSLKVFAFAPRLMQHILHWDQLSFTQHV